MNVLFAPAARLMNRLRYPQKFGLIGLLASLAIGMLLIQTYTALTSKIDVARREITGIALYASSQRVLQEMQRHRGLCAGAGYGAATFQHRLMENIPQADRALAAMDALLGDKEADMTQWHAIQRDWGLLRVRCGAVPAAESFAWHTRLIDQMQSYGVVLADTYSLTLDPKVDSYYLLDTAVTKYPDLLEQLAQLRGKVTGVLAAGKLAKQQEADLLQGLARVDDAKRRMRTDISTAAKAVPAPVAAKLNHALQVIEDEGHLLNRDITHDVLGERFSMAALPFYDRVTKLVDLGYQQLFDTILPTAKDAVNLRLQQDLRTLWLTLSFSLLVLLLLAYLFASAYYAMLSNIRDFSTMAGRIAGGDLSGRVKLSAQDELQDIADAFNRVASSLAESMTRLQRRADLSARLQQAQSSSEMGQVILDSIGALFVSTWRRFLFWNEGQQLMQVVAEQGEPQEEEPTWWKTPIEVDGQMIACMEIDSSAPQTENAQSYFEELLPIIRLNTAIRWRNEQTELLLTETQQQAASLEEAIGHAEELSAEQEAVLSNAPMGVLFVRADVIGLCNSRLASMLGYSTPYLLRSQPMERLFDDVSEYKALSLRTQAAQGARIDTDFDVNLRHFDGSLIPTRITGRYLDSNDTSKGCVWIVEDVTERRRAEQELREREHYFRAVFDNAGVGFISLTPAGVLTMSNDRFCDYVAYPRSTLLGMNIHQLVLPEDLGVLDESLARLSRQLHQDQPQAQSQELRLLTQTGAVCWGTIHCMGIFQQDNTLKEVVISFLDISYLKETEEAMREAKAVAESANRAKSDFLANMSHEIRTPMNAVIGLSQLALQTDLSFKQRNYLQKIEGAAQALLRIINDILDFSKIEAGKLQVERVDFRLDQVLESMSDMFELKAEDNNVELLFDIGADVPMHLNGDPLRLSQIFINLIGNAIKFTNNGTVIVSAQKLSEDHDGYRIGFAVRDSGIGLTEEQAAKLFKAFSQADGSTTRKYGGTGLGLAISKRLIELMGGEIGVDSVYGEGASFHFTVQLGYSTENAVEHAEALKDLSGLKVLVVDDNPTSLEILQHILTSFTCQVWVANSGYDALDLCAEQPFDLIVLDWKMPGMDGLEVARRLHAGSKPPPPIIMLSAFAREEALAKAKEVGLKYFLHKPVTPSMLCDAMLNVFGKSYISRPYKPQQGEEAALDLHLLAGHRVLLVEDNEINQEVALEFLNKVGIQVTVANHGGEAVEMLTAGLPVELVLMDLQMPVMDGFEASHCIRALEHYQALPIIAMTANAMSGDRERCLAAGMNDHIAKPVDVNELYGALLRWLGASAMPTLKPTPLPATQRAEAAPLPEIEGLDAELGLRRVGENLSLYLKILNKYWQSNETTASELSSAFAGGDYPLAERLAHTLKGVSASIGAEALAAAAAEIESCARQQQSPQPLVFARVFDQLEHLREQIRRYLASLAPAAPAAPAAAQVDWRELAPEFQRLAQLLAADDSSAIGCLEALLSRIGDPLTSEALAGLAKMVRNYDFENALNQLREVSGQVGIDLAPS